MTRLAIRAAVTLVLGVPLATVSLVAAIYVHEAIEGRRWRAHPNVGREHQHEGGCCDEEVPT